MNRYIRGVMREAAFDAIDEERAYQDRKFGPKSDRTNSLGDFLAYIHTYWDLATIQRTHGNNEAVRHSIRKIAALAVAALETHGVRTRTQEEREKDEAADVSFPAFDEILRAAMQGDSIDRLNPYNAAMGGPVPQYTEDPFNEFLRGERVAAETETIYPNANAVVEGELNHLPPELRAVLENVFENIKPGTGVKVIFHSPLR